MVYATWPRFGDAISLPRYAYAWRERCLHSRRCRARKVKAIHLEVANARRRANLPDVLAALVAGRCWEWNGLKRSGSMEEISLSAWSRRPRNEVAGRRSERLPLRFQCTVRSKGWLIATSACPLLLLYAVSSPYDLLEIMKEKQVAVYGVVDTTGVLG